MSEEKHLDRIDLETHFYTKEYVKTLISNRNYPRLEENKGLAGYRLWYNADVWQRHDDVLMDKLLDVTEKRLNAMNATGVTMQALSLSAPGCEEFDVPTGTALSKKANDELAKIVEKQPDKFIGFAALAPQNPGEAADELERAVKELGLKGWKTHSNIRGTYLDDEKYWVILDKAERLDIPIYLHPTIPAITQLRKYGMTLAGASFGFTFETAMCMMRLIFGGVFEKYHRLKFILGHLGETIPFLLNRIDSKTYIKLPKKPSDYFKNNVFVTTSGVFSQSALICTYEVMGADMMLFATDYPYEDIKESEKRIEALPISVDHKEKIYHINAQRLLQLR